MTVIVPGAVGLVVESDAVQVKAPISTRVIVFSVALFPTIVKFDPPKDFTSRPKILTVLVSNVRVGLVNVVAFPLAEILPPV